MKMIVEGGGDNFFLLMSCVLRYRQQRSSLLLKFLPELFGLDPMFSTKPDVSAVKIVCTKVRWYTLVTTVLWLRLTKEIVSMEIFHFDYDLNINLRTCLLYTSRCV